MAEITTFPDFTMTVGDTGPAILYQLIDEYGEPVDLTGKSVTFSMRRLQDASPTITNAPATIDAAATGEVRYSWQAADTDTAGLYAAKWRVVEDDKTFPNGRDLYVFIRAGV